MAAKKNLSPEAYARQIGGLQPYVKYERPTSKSPVRLYEDQDSKLIAIAKKEGKSKSEVVRDAIDFYLESIASDSTAN